MKSFLTAGAVLAAAFSTGAYADLCSEGSTDDNGNWYCQEVTAITYTGAGGSGSYDKITDMPTSGSCSSSAYSYSGSMAPLDEEVSRSLSRLSLPIANKTSSSSSSSSKTKRGAHHRHAHAHAHKREAEPVEEVADVEERAVGTEVYATIDGVVVSWANQYGGAATTSTKAAAAAATTTSTKKAAAATTTAAAGTTSTKAAAAAASSSSSSSGASSGAWVQKSYYNAASGTADNVTFLNHFGGTGSGVFDYVYGNSLSYASASGTTGASSPQVLSDVQLGSNVEVLIMSGTECENDDCGYVRPGTVAYHGFGGAQKAFFFEFEMPLDGETDASTNGDMPAIWMLNAQIPNTLQYGAADCSCWTSGCGEFDIFEVLAPGDLRCKSTLHGNIAGGDSDYFARPTTGTMKAVLVMNGNDIHIMELSSDYDFSGSSISAADISDICSETSTQSSVVSIFTLSS
ncbi:hypothetical protein BT93_L4498 [Corymbia citriodora subsp. variegata]|uniref:glucan endo-1,3-beta-D-glucosidase n=1 Tax=Corymbia citriodora subsp. variegata TaxID=360336 RepID=A0A8T0CG03_CORYI|nr:hypothetical protein BT93_L4498 [Corymbia citriodora subsp. variegata]